MRQNRTRIVGIVALVCCVLVPRLDAQGLTAVAQTVPLPDEVQPAIKTAIGATTGAYQGVALGGLTVVAAVAGDRNLGMRELGGEAASVVRAIITVDLRATPEQREALVNLARELSGGLITEVVRVESAPIRFATTARYIEVSASDTVQLTVNKEMTHDPSCGAMQWFHPFASLDESAMGTADAHAFSGAGLGTRWSAPGKRSAFFGTFSY